MNQLLLVVGVAPILVFIVIVVWCVTSRCKRSNSSSSSASIASPSPNLADPLLEGKETTSLGEGLWRCSVCEFENQSANNDGTCLLCGTARDFSFELSQPPSTGDMDKAGARTPTFNRTRSFAIRCLNKLNARQRGARNRQLWTRKVGPDGQWYWSKRDPVTLRSQSSMSIVLPSESQKAEVTRDESDQQTSSHVCIDVDKDTMQKPMLETQRSLAFVSQLARTPEHPDGQLVFVDYRQVDANVATSNGYTISTDDQKVLEEVAALSFKEKYAWFLRQAAEIISPWERGHLKMRIKRENIMEESLHQLLGVQMKHMHKPLRIQFVDEVAIDAGGLEREWFTLVTQKLFAEETGLFQCTDVDSLSYVINPRSGELVEDHLLYFRGAGRLIGRALLEGLFMDAHLALPFLKHLLGVPISFGDLEFVDRDVYKSLKWMLENTGVEALALDFSVSKQLKNGEVEVIDLKENGRHIEVTDANKHEYISLRLRYIMLDAVAEQLQHFMKGLFEVVPQELILIFDYQELELVLCGVPKIDVNDWKAHTRVIEDFPSELLTWFWEIVAAFNDEERARLLQYTTGSSRVPVQGFKALTSYDGRVCPFTLKSVPYPEQEYPNAHTCFNRIDMPQYESKEQLQEVLDQVINMEVTGFTTE